MKAYRAKSDLRKPARTESDKESAAQPHTTVQTQADSASAEYAASFGRPGAMISNVSKTLQRRSMASIGVGKTPIFPKMTVNAPNDKYEREADNMAKEVVQRVQKSPQSAASTQSNAEQQSEKRQKTIQRQPNPDIAFSDKEFDFNGVAGRHLMAHETIHNARQQGLLSQVDLDKAPDLDPSIEARIKNIQEREGIQRKSSVQREADDGGMEASADVETSINQESGKGQPLPEDLQVSMEEAFGADFSRVRVHRDLKAQDLAQSLNARAFTTGPDIFFNQGAYNPNSKSGQELLAHELTHVIQQGGG
ncbi:MAG: DUF4157 domain-containing protein [Cyanobacteria bacterium P01_F01_bin.150]